MKLIFTSTLLILATFGYSQITIDFEEFGLAIDNFDNGNSGVGQFESDGFLFSNNYDSNYDSWYGFSVSTMTDVTTAGFTNQYSAASGNGADASLTYMVASVFGPTMIKRPASQVMTKFKSCSINNSTYAYLSMRDGDAFAKIFGGADGNDPDFFELTVRGFVGTQELPNAISFMLADFRFADNSQDYILNEWTELDLTPLADAESLIFELNSSDVGQFGMNTPAYFCLDNLVYDGSSSVEPDAFSSIKVYPNPVVEYINIEAMPSNITKYQIIDFGGRLIDQGALQGGESRIDARALKSGNYQLILLDDSNKLFSYQLAI